MPSASLLPDLPQVAGAEGWDAGLQGFRVGRWVEA